jgi:hypothetical protein
MIQTIKSILVFLFLILPCIAFTQVNIPDVNKRILQYLEMVIGTTVGRGECWDLADQALFNAGAQFDRSSKNTLYVFGRKYNPRQEAILPGDVIQFEDVKVSYQDGNMIFTENYNHHTAIVFNVRKDGSLQLAHQNTSFGGRQVALSEFDLKNVKKGKMYFYRPVQK